MTGLAVPPPADAILERLGPPLLKLFDRDDVRIGGGTALAARWQHRRSTDIDLCVAPELFAAPERMSGPWPSSPVRKASGLVKDG